ncbi:MAG: hypothetical protein ABSG86_17280 [Thermoguttaceae bacterium]
MTPLWPLLIGLLAAAPADGPGPAGRIEARRASEEWRTDGCRAASPGPSVEVFRCRFEPGQDRDYDGWPDGWTRGRGPGYPRYVRIRIGEESPPHGGRSLRVDLDGGGALAQGPRIPVHPASAYVLEADLDAAGLTHDRAYVSLTFFGAQRSPLGSFRSEPVRTTSGWQRVRLGPLSPPAAAALAVIGLHVQPGADAEDLHGTVRFGDLRLGRMPRVALSAGQAAAAPAAALGLFSDFRNIRIVCNVSGLDSGPAAATFCLQDAGSRELARHTQRFALDHGTGPAGPSEGSPEHAGEYAGTVAWNPPVPGPGFYRVRATVVEDPDVPAGKLAGKAAREGVPRACSASSPKTSTAEPAAGTAPRRAPPGTRLEWSAGPWHTAAELTFAVIEPRRAPPGSEFGWSLPRGDRPLPLPLLGELVCQAGAGWVKFPVVPGDGTSGSAAGTSGPAAGARPTPLEPLVAFGDRLSDGGVRLVGLACPPQSQAAMELFGQNPKTWAAALELVQGRLGPRIGWWQLGDDRDSSWIGCPDLARRVAAVKTALQRIGQDTHVGIPWDWRQPPADNLGEKSPSPSGRGAGGEGASSGNPPINPDGSDIPLTPALSRRERGTLRLPFHTASEKPTISHQPPWDFLSLAAGEPVSTEQLAARLDAAQAAPVARWIPLEAVAAGDQSPQTRAGDLVRRMVLAKAHGAEGVFCPDPFDPRRGLVHEDGSPGELLLPWRSAALALGGAKPLGRTSLRGGSTAWLFHRSGELVAAVWNDSPLEETVYLGDDLRELDLWGGSRPCPATVVGPDSGPAFRQSTIRVGPLPVFLAGLNGPLTRWQLDAAVEPGRLPSIPATPLQASLRLANSFAEAVAGRVRLAPPERWQIEPCEIEFRLAPGQSQQWPLTIALPLEVTAGSHAVALEFQLQADHPYRFQAWRQIAIGMDDVRVAATARLNDRGELEVEQTLVNQGGRPVSFACWLLAPDRRRQSSQIVGLARGSDRQLYRLSDGRELLGKTLWVRAEEIDGPRVLNYRLAAPEAAGPKRDGRPSDQADRLAM